MATEPIKKQAGMGLDAPTVATPQVTPANGRNEDGRPYCGKHNALMTAVSTQGKATYYRCQVAGCEETEKKIRPDIRVPAKPVLCSRSACSEQGTALEVDAARTKGSYSQLTMVCPSCGETQYVPKPGYVPTPQRAESVDFASR